MYRRQIAWRGVSALDLVDDVRLRAGCVRGPKDWFRQMVEKLPEVMGWRVEDLEKLGEKHLWTEYLSDVLRRYWPVDDVQRHWHVGRRSARVLETQAFIS